MNDHKDIRRIIERDFDATIEQRDAANEDMRFCNVDGGMWEGWLEETHINRARLELDLVSDYVQRFNGEWTQNRANVTFTAGDEQMDEEEVDFINGLYRADYREFAGQLSIDNAVYEMSECGAGAYKLCAKYEDEEDPENTHQDVHFEPIHNAYNHVIWDSNAKRVDKADARHCTLLTSYTKDAFTEEWPDAETSSAFTPNNRSYLSWNSDDLIYVAEYYEVKKEKVKVKIYQNPDLIKVKHLEDNEDLAKAESQLLQDGWEFLREKTITKRSVYRSVLNGSDYLEERQRIAGKYIPIIPLYGYRKYIDGSEYYRGLVRKLKDANRLLNANASKLAETSATAGTEIPILTESQVEGKENLWADRTDKAYMVINDLEDSDGNTIPSGPVGYLKPPQVDPSSAAVIELSTSFVQKTTGVAQDQIDPNSSGKAINALRTRENLNTQVLSDNILSSIEHSGKVWLEMAKEIYAENRVKSIIGEDGTQSIDQILKAVMDKTGEMVEIHDLSKNKFKVVAEVGPQYETQREATLDSVERIIDKVGQESQYFTPLIAMWMENVQGTGLAPLKKFNRKQMIIQGLVEPETDEEKQMVQALSQQQDPQQGLVEAATQQQLAEAENLKASSIQKMADAKKKNAEALETTMNMKSDFIQRRLEQLSTKPKRLRYNAQTGQLENAGS